MKTMPLTRKTSFAAALVVALAGTPAVGTVQMPSGHGAQGPVPVVPLATLPRRPRLRRPSRYSRVRRFPTRSPGRLRAAAAAIGHRRQNLRPRLRRRNSYARPPPR
jgi:hypothetical protein